VASLYDVGVETMDLKKGNEQEAVGRVRGVVDRIAREGLCTPRTDLSPHARPITP
jgi:hypothetical protein